MAIEMYRRTIRVAATQWDGTLESAQEISDWMRAEGGNTALSYYPPEVSASGEPEMFFGKWGDYFEVEKGDYIMLGEDREYRLFTADVFEDEHEAE